MRWSIFFFNSINNTAFGHCISIANGHAVSQVVSLGVTFTRTPNTQQTQHSNRPSHALRRPNRWKVNTNRSRGEIERKKIISPFQKIHCLYLDLDFLYFSALHQMSLLGVFKWINTHTLTCECTMYRWNRLVKLHSRNGLTDIFVSFTIPFIVVGSGQNVRNDHKVIMWA